LDIKDQSFDFGSLLPAPPHLAKAQSFNVPGINNNTTEKVLEFIEMSTGAISSSHNNKIGGGSNNNYQFDPPFVTEQSMKLSHLNKNSP
jgi:hypothetical protein